MISIVSGTINRIKLLQEMVGSVRESVGTLDYEIILVDCNSKDGTREWCRKQEDVVLIEHPEPRGAAIAFQDGCEHARGEYVTVLNDDIAVGGDTIHRSAAFLDMHPEVGQVAYGHQYQNRTDRNPERAVTQSMWGYTYAQCGMVRRWLGEMAGWTGNKTEGYIHYAWDNHLSARIWELGWKVVPVRGCYVRDWEHVDEIREKFSDAPRAAAGGQHPDTVLFHKHWRHRLPRPTEWIPSRAVNPSLEERILQKVAARTLKTLRFKGMMRPGHQMRMACINAFAAYGESFQVNQSAARKKYGAAGYQTWALDQVKHYKPDLVMLQAQRANNITPATVWRMRTDNPEMYILNWDGDTHYPMEQYQFDVAAASHLQLTISPSLFPVYARHGAPNIGYWPIAVEDCYIETTRPAQPRGPDVVFLGGLYGVGKFPQAATRRDAVKVLHDSDIKLILRGKGWEQIGLVDVGYTGEKHRANAQLYAQGKMALSISQTNELWGYTSDRTYNICATGCPVLLQRFVGMEEHGFVEGETCIAWTEIDEILGKVRYYLNHPKEREAIGRAGRELVLQRHNWPQRLVGLWRMLGSYSQPIETNIG